MINQCFFWGDWLQIPGPQSETIETCLETCIEKLIFTYVLRIQIYLHTIVSNYMHISIYIYNSVQSSRYKYDTISTVLIQCQSCPSILISLISRFCHFGEPHSVDKRFAYDIDGAVVSLGRKQFDASAAMFGSDFLKLICCPTGCRKQGGCWVMIFMQGHGPFFSLS